MKRMVLPFLLLTSCATSSAPRSTSAAETDSHGELVTPRPDWLAGLALQFEDVLVCTSERAPPVQVLDVHALADGVTGVMVADGTGQVDRCAAQRGVMLLREPASLDPESFHGRPVFSPGGERPAALPVGVLLEEVTSRDDVVLGWIYWPL